MRAERSRLRDLVLALHVALRLMGHIAALIIKNIGFGGPMILYPKP